MTLIHGAGVVAAAVEDGDIFAAVLVEAAEAVEELELRARRRREPRQAAGSAARAAASRAARRLRQQGELIGDARRAGPTRTTRATAAMQRRAPPGSSGRRAARETVPCASSAAEPRARLAAAHRGLDRDLQVLHVGGRMLVDDHQIDARAASSASIHARAAAGATWAMSSISSMRSSTIGRSPEIACGHSADCGPAPRAIAASDGRGSARRRRGSAPRAAGSRPPPARRCRDGAAAPAPASRRASAPGRRRCGRGACRSGRAAPRATARPASRRRSAPSRPAGSAPAGAARRSDRAPCPTVFDSGRSSTIAVGVGGGAAAAEEAGPVGLVLLSGRPPRPRRRRNAPPRPAARRASAGGASRSSAPNSARCSVWTNSLAKAGWAASAAGVVSTSSAIGGELDLARRAGRCWSATPAGPRRRPRPRRGRRAWWSASRRAG